MREFEGFIGLIQRSVQDVYFIIVLNTLIHCSIVFSYFNYYWRDRGTCYRIREAQTCSKIRC